MPITSHQSKRNTQVHQRTVRPLPESQIVKFGARLAQEDWDFLSSELSPTELVASFEAYTSNVVEELFPEKTVSITSFDKPYMTQELKQLRRRKQRAYRKGSKSDAYLKLKAEFDTKLKREALKYKNKILQEVSEGRRSNPYKALRKLEFKFQEQSNKFTLPNHADLELSDSEIAERLAIYFSAISQEFEPLKFEELPRSIRDSVENSIGDQTKPSLNEWQVYRRLSVAKKPKTTVPGDIPIKLVKDFTPELATPIAKIFNRITETGEYPRQWVTEYQVAIPKIDVPNSEDDLRNIASTAFFSKQYEAFLAEWLFPFIEPFLDPGQCGGLKGSSTTHYLVKLLHFIHLHLDQKEPYAVLLALIDLEKAFNRVSHCLVIEDLAAMHVPGWMLKILISYLTDRSMYMRFNGASSPRKNLPGSSPQGALLGILLFIIIFNGAILRPRIPRVGSLALKYIDDLSILQAINLKECLAKDNEYRPFPLNFNERTGLALPPENNPLQEVLFELEDFTETKQLRIKEKKTNIMKFNVSQKFDFPPELIMNKFDNQLEVVKKTKLLGVILTDDLKWAANTQFICQKAFKKLWILRRLKLLNVDPFIALDVYTKEIRSVLEVSVPAWHSGLTNRQSFNIERVQKVAVAIILGNSGLSYHEKLRILGLETLEQRREKICLTFAKRTLKSRHSSIFERTNTTYNTRQQTVFRECRSNTSRFYKSPLNYLTRLLNSS